MYCKLIEIYSAKIAQNELSRELKHSNSKHAALARHFKGKPFFWTHLFVRISSMEISVIPIISMELLSILKIIKGNYTQYLGQTSSQAYETGGGTSHFGRNGSY